MKCASSFALVALCTSSLVTELKNNTYLTFVSFNKGRINGMVPVIMHGLYDQTKKERTCLSLT